MIGCARHLCSRGKCTRPSSLGEDAGKLPDALGDLGGSGCTVGEAEEWGRGFVDEVVSPVSDEHSCGVALSR